MPSANKIVVSPSSARVLKKSASVPHPRASHPTSPPSSRRRRRPHARSTRTHHISRPPSHAIAPSSSPSRIRPPNAQNPFVPLLNGQTRIRPSPIPRPSSPAPRPPPLETLREITPDVAFLALSGPSLVLNRRRFSILRLHEPSVARSTRGIHSFVTAASATSASTAHRARTLANFPGVADVERFVASPSAIARASSRCVHGVARDRPRRRRRDRVLGNTHGCISDALRGSTSTCATRARWSIRRLRAARVRETNRRDGTMRAR